MQGKAISDQKQANNNQKVGFNRMSMNNLSNMRDQADLSVRNDDVGQMSVRDSRRELIVDHAQMCIDDEADTFRGEQEKPRH